MEKLLKFPYKLLNMRTYIFHRGNKTFKLYAPHKISYRRAELQGNKAALGIAFWSGYVLEIEPSLYSVSMAKGKSFPQEEAHLINDFAENQLAAALHFPKQNMSGAFDFEKLRTLESRGLDSRLLNEVREMVSSVSLPVTSSHGDFHAGNILCLKGKLKIIDWSMFNPRGSFITDYIHFFNYRNSVIFGQSWTEAILRDEDYLKTLAGLTSVPVHQLRLLYCLSRIAGELSQRKSADEVLTRQIQKYNRVLNCILNDSSKAFF